MSIRTLGTLFLLTAGGLLLAGCGGGTGGGGFVAPDGELAVDNQTDLSVAPDEVVYFSTAPSGTPFYSGNRLSGPLQPGVMEYVGYEPEDYYDAEAELFFDPVLIEYFDVFVSGYDTTIFDVY